MIFAVDRLAPEIAQRVVHPAHVPLEGKTEPAEIRRARDLRPGGGFLGDGHDAGKFRVRDVVEFFQEFDGLQIFAAAKLVRDPFAFLARIIEVKHRGDGVHAQAVNVKTLAPEERVGDEKIGNFVPAIIEDQRAPILMRALARVFVLVKRRAVELAPAPIHRAENAPAPSPRSRRCRPRAAR